MTDTIFCESCGKSVAADAHFCEHCGTGLSAAPQVGVGPQVGAAAASPSSPTGVVSSPPAQAFVGAAGQARAGFAAQPAAERIEALTPGATELASQLAEQLRTPLVAAALVAGSLAAGAVFVIGVVLALVFSDQSLLGAVDFGKGAITAGFAQMLNFLQVGYGSGVGKLGPALFVIFPIGACAVAAASQAKRTRSLAPTSRLLAGAGAGLVFGLLMVVPALAAGGFGSAASNIEPNVLSAILLGVLWGTVGGTLGAYHVVRAELASGWLATLAPAIVGDVVKTVFVALRPLALVLALMTAVGTVTWTVETLLKSSLREGQSTLWGTVDNAAYGVEHGVHWTELGGVAQFQATGDGVNTLGVPVPIGDVTKISTDSKGAYRVFGLNKAMPSYTFIPLLIFLLSIPLLLALNAGFAVARLRKPRTQWIAAAWGCLVGPIWALGLVIVNALVAKSFFGHAVGDSVFGSFLLGGLVLGAVGGLLSAQSPQTAAGGSAADAGVAS
jgi:hypothetical protein